MDQTNEVWHIVAKGSNQNHGVEYNVILIFIMLNQLQWNMKWKMCITCLLLSLVI